jgi:RND family efflux transporter MFP subunit
MGPLPNLSVWIIGIPATLLLAGCGQSQADSSRQKPPPTVVIVSSPVEQSIVDFVEYTGRTEAAETVEIRARVTGFLQSVKFEEGAEVAKDSLLYQIDDREYKADLEAAQGELKSALAHQEKTTTDFQRMAALKQKGAASAEEYDRADAAKKEADANVESGQAKVDRAQLNVDFSTILAPIAGKISRTQITEGNLINANVSVLTNIVSVDPINVLFDVDERTVLTIQQQIREGQLGSKKEDPTVLLGLTTDTGYPHVGEIDFIDNKVDPRTGTIRVRGKFQNPKPERGERILTPGLFSRIRVPIGKPHTALLITDRAIGTDQGQKFVYVVDDKNEVAFRPIKLGAAHDGLRVVAEGLKAGERLIIDGLQRVRPGSIVDPKVHDMRSRPGDAAGGNATQKPEAKDESEAKPSGGSPP